MQKWFLFVGMTALLLGCGGKTESAPAAAAAPKAELFRPGGDPGTNLPSKDWQVSSGTIDVRCKEIEGWHTANNIDPKEDGGRIIAMKFEVGDKSSAPDWVSKGSWYDKPNS
ncbi:MAG: hypothetical protein V3T05_11510, partial [Myxococcota bacterium]